MIEFARGLLRGHRENELTGCGPTVSLTQPERLLKVETRACLIRASRDPKAALTLGLIQAKARAYIL